MGGHGVSLQTRENMDMIENIKQQMQAEVSFETEDLKHSIYYSKHNIYDSKHSICQPDDWNHYNIVATVEKITANAIVQHDSG